MSDIFEVLAQNIVPIFLVAGLGYVLRRRMELEKKTLSSVVFYGLSPALVFSSLVNSKLAGSELLQLASFTVAVVLAMGLLGLAIGWLIKLPRQDTIALLIVLMFVNGGNYGLTLNSLRYGSDGLARAVVYYVVSTVLVFTLGVFIASLGRTNWRESLTRLVRLPAVYAVVAALVVYSFSIPLPAPLMRGIEVAGAGAIPVMIVVLGMQIADLESMDGLRLAMPAAVIRLAAAPLVALAVATMLQLRGLAHSTAIIEASMPTAVITTILATEFDVRPALVTSTVVLSTLLSPITLPIVITLLGL